jgi:hypothetical protein
MVQSKISQRICLLIHLPPNMPKQNLFRSLQPLHQPQQLLKQTLINHLNAPRIQTPISQSSNNPLRNPLYQILRVRFYHYLPHFLPTIHHISRNSQAHDPSSEFGGLVDVEGGDFGVVVEV